MELQELFINKDIDSFTIYVCKQNNLLDLESILDYHQNHNNFLGLDYCSKEDNQKLLLLCSKYSSRSVNTEKTNLPQEPLRFDQKHIPNYSLEQLAEIEELGIRSQNACKYFSLNSLKDIIHYYKKNGDFLKVRNCGRKSNDELIEVCKKYEEFFINELITQIEEESKNPIVAKIETLKVRQKKILNNLIASSFNDLSVRASNALKNYLEGEINIKGIKSLFADKNLKLTNLRNVGKKSIDEIQTFLDFSKDQIEIVSIFENEDELTTELFNSFLTKTFNLSPAILSEIGKEYDFSNGLPIFKALQILIDREILFDSRDKVVFEKGLMFNNSYKVCSLDEIAKKLNLTRERIRQIRKQVYDNLNSTLSFVKILEFDSLNLYGIDYNTDIISIDEETISEINTKENNSFNELFVNKILSIILSQNFLLIGNEENTLCQRIIRTAHNWHTTYLIQKEIVNIFNFESFANDVSKRLSERIEEDYSFHFEAYILDFSIDEIENSLTSILQICEHILFNEFEISLDIYENIVFKRNTKKQVIEYVYDVLEEKNEPMTVYEIYGIIKSKHPNVTRSAEALRGSCQRDPNLIYFGRSSTYGLKVWENELDVKGGTIRSITEEYLNQFDTPKHIIEITDYVNKFRDTNAKSILSNLKLDESSSFIFFPQSFVGLSEKTINNAYDKYKHLPRFLGKTIMRKIRAEKEISNEDLRDYIISKIQIPTTHAQMIINQLIADGYINIENLTLTANYENRRYQE
ncbi:DNA-directed RNA polymerase subunit alpha C-terminal domain-containing protein [Maribellus maritimus]|uniref:DNA-directed RNA polymerase subunit alpha C-terminal domain-containing protein n=1 Tax=Maribellus maritimus TaxID=2870838 RepID=UPI001EEB3ABC|nr:DNA-directed RNA polymerase subunit alpha C-terminal domain-containing protein [Maribellus maritimus]MCG6191358.1 hypothetical protein [Maribellus maritimus]